jgi:DNA-directed RNA polymerase specialized sigma24 family protein
VSARNASGAELRIRAASFGARKTVEDFDWDPQPAIRQQIGALASGGFLTAPRNVRMESTDESEWAKALLGDGEAFGAVFDRHRGRVFRHSYRLVASSADADDLVAIVFLEAWRRKYSLRFVDGSVLPWLLVTATNSARNLLRNSRRYQQVLSELPYKVRSENELFDSDDGVAETLMRDFSIGHQRVLDRIGRGRV